jgi:hypothetical protein
LDDEIWEVRFHLDGKDNLERKLGRSDITLLNLMALVETEGYGWGDSLYYVKEEGTCIAGMAPIDNMSAIEEMLVQYAEHQCVSITVIKGKSGPAAGLNSKRYEEQISISDMGDDVVYSVDVQGVLFDSQQGASDSDYMYLPTQQSNNQKNKQIVVETGEEYILT